MTKPVISEEKPSRSSLEVLAEMSDFLVGSLNMQEAMQSALEKLIDFLGGNLCIGLTVLENDDQDLLVTANLCTDERLEFEEVGVRFKLEDIAASQWVIENGRYLHVPNIETYFSDNKRAEAALESGLRSMLYVPLMAYSRPVGIMHIDAWLAPREFTQEEIQLCQGVANLVAAAIENGRLLTAERKQLVLAQTLQKVGSLLTAYLSLDELYDQLFSLLAEVVVYDSVSLQLFDKKTNSVQLVASKGFDYSAMDETMLDAIARHSLKKFSSDQYIRIISDTQASELWVTEPNVGQVRSWIGVLLRVKGDVLGVLNVDSYEVNAFKPEDGDLVAAFANQAAIAIENTRLYKEADRRATELSILHQLALDTAAVVDLDELYSKVTEAIASTLYPESFGFALVAENGGLVSPHPSFHGISLAKLNRSISVHGTTCGDAIENGQPVIVPDLRETARCVLANVGMLSEVVVPIKIDNAVIGVINAQSRQVNAFSQNDVVFLTTLGGLISASVARSRMYHQLQVYSEYLEKEVAEQTTELKLERDRTIAILEHAGESILLLDSAAEIVYVNQEMINQSGYTGAQLMGKTLLFLDSGLTPTAVYSELWDRVTHGQSWTGQLINKRQDDSFYDVVMTMAPVKTLEDEVTGFVVVQANITRLKEIERLKTEFVTNVTHELRTPLTNIKTYVALAERGREEKKARYFQILNHETDRLTQLIQDLLDLSHLETEAPLRYVEPVDLDLIIQEYVDIFQAKAGLREIQLTYHGFNGKTAVSIEDKHIGQLLTNLLGNAIAYTPSGGQIGVEVGWLKTAVPHQIWFKVTDTGKGIPAEEMPYLFDRFYRGAYSQKEGIPGTGLGLAICQGIVNRYHGHMAVVSEEGHGTTVTVYLPEAQQLEE